MSAARNLTSGSIVRTVLVFSLPYLLSCFLQTLYGMADLYIIGQFNAVESTTAVSVGSQIMHMLTVMIVGLAMGSTVCIGRCVGAEDHERMNRAVGNTVTVFLILAAVVTAVLLLCVRGVVSLMSVPAESVEETVQYLTVCFWGIPFITAYNIIASVFRGMGDSRSPMIFIFIACLCNIALDYLFIGALGMGARGAALGTVLAQTLSVAVSLFFVVRKKMLPGLSGRDLRPERSVIRDILGVGIPVAVQDGFIQISFLIITIIVNRRGVTDAAAVGIVEKVISFLFLVPSAMLSSVSALGAQNLGAGKPERARQTLYCALAIAVGYGLVIAGLMQLIPEQTVGLFTKDPEVVRMGGQYLKSYVFDTVLAGVHFCFSGYFCAICRSGISFAHNAASILLARIPLAWTFSRRFPTTLYPMGWAAPIGSGLSAVICVFAYLLLRHKEKKQTA